MPVNCLCELSMGRYNYYSVVCGLVYFVVLQQPTLSNCHNHGNRFEKFVTRSRCHAGHPTTAKQAGFGSNVLEFGAEPLVFTRRL